MPIRLVILLVAACGLGVYYGTRPPVAEKPVEYVDDDRHDQLPLYLRELIGVEPPEEPQFDVEIVVSLAGGKNQLCLTITEVHGYYVETLNVEFWWSGPDGTIEYDDSVVHLLINMDKYIKSGEPLVHCLEITPVELAFIDGNMGGDENWAARVRDYHRAREENPNPLPVILRPFQNANETIMTG